MVVMVVIMIPLMMRTPPQVMYYADFLSRTPFPPSADYVAEVLKQAYAIPGEVTVLSPTEAGCACCHLTPCSIRKSFFLCLK
jgi:hypothetical protein